MDSGQSGNAPDGTTMPHSQCCEAIGDGGPRQKAQSTFCCPISPTFSGSWWRMMRCSCCELNGWLGKDREPVQGPWSRCWNNQETQVNTGREVIQHSWHGLRPLKRPMNWDGRRSFWIKEPSGIQQESPQRFFRIYLRWFNYIVSKMIDLQDLHNMIGNDFL